MKGGLGMMKIDKNIPLDSAKGHGKYSGTARQMGRGHSVFCKDTDEARGLSAQIRLQGYQPRQRTVTEKNEDGFLVNGVRVWKCERLREGNKDESK